MYGPHHFSFDDRITDGQRAYYDEYGFIVFKSVLSAEAVEIIRNDAAALEARTLAGQIPGSDVDDLTRPSADEEGRTILHRLPYFTRYSPATREIVVSERWLAMGRGLQGPGTWLLEDTMGGVIWQLKKGGKSSAYSSINWHFDFPEDHGLVPVVSAGIYLNDSTAENGCLAVVPGSHKFASSRVPPLPVLVEVRAGDVVCHAYNLYHASGPVTQEGGNRATLYLYLCGGQYPGPNIPFAPPEKKKTIRTLFVATRSGGE